LNNRVAWTYDARGRVTQESRVINGTGGGTFVTQWGYDSADRPMWQKYPGGNGGQIGEQVSYAYTAQGLLKSVSGWNTYVGDTFYNVRGQVTERRLGSASGVVKQQYAYTAAENFRLVSLKAGTSPNYDNRQKISYTYDDDGNIETIADAAAYGGSQVQAFAYDTLDRLSTAQASGSTTYGGYTQRSYAYSNAGNITSFEGAALTYQNSAHKHAVTHIGGVQKYWYDANGNATRRVNGSQDITLTYDAENRLTAMSGSVASSYVYDADGNRVKETIGGVTRVFVGNTYEIDNGTVKKYYYAGNVRVAESSGGTLYYLLGDHLGSQALTLTSAGARLNTNTELRYMPYGAARYTAGTTPTSYNFTGQRKDSSSGLLFYNARWYDPTVGRFLQADTIIQSNARDAKPILPLIVSYAEPGLVAHWNEFQRSGRQAITPHDSQLLNRYTYARNNPLSYRDDTGHVIWWVVGGIGGAVVGFGAYALTHQDNFDWGQAALWTGGGAVVGATFGAGAQWVAGALTAEAAAATGTAATTAGVAASSPTGQRTILWLENQLPRVQHIMAQKHAWDKLVNLGGNLQQDYQAVQPYLSQVVQTGERTIMEGGSVQYRAFINGQEVIVRGIELANGAFQIADAFVKTVTR
ncbi:MAG: RHS repeat-associated core domain-containing protein, partial [Anaerolineae bacterium]